MHVTGRIRIIAEPVGGFRGHSQQLAHLVRRFAPEYGLFQLTGKTAEAHGGAQFPLMVEHRCRDGHDARHGESEIVRVSSRASDLTHLRHAMMEGRLFAAGFGGEAIVFHGLVEAFVTKECE